MIGLLLREALDRLCVRLNTYLVQHVSVLQNAIRRRSNKDNCKKRKYLIHPVDIIIRK